MLFFSFKLHRLWLTPIARLPLMRVYLRCRSSARGGGDEAVKHVSFPFLSTCIICGASVNDTNVDGQTRHSPHHTIGIVHRPTIRFEDGPPSPTKLRVGCSCVFCWWLASSFFASSPLVAWYLSFFEANNKVSLACLSGTCLFGTLQDCRHTQPHHHL